MALTRIVEKLNDKNLKLSKSVKTDTKKNKGKVNKSHSGNITDKNKTNGKKYSLMQPQGKWRL